MNIILHQRLHNQLLLNHTLHSPEEVVKHMLCIQSQDFKQHLRAIASRCGCSSDTIEQAYNNGLIVKTWTQRGTIHCIASEDFQWMIKICASKTLGGFAKRRQNLGISDQIIHDAEQIIRKVLSKGPLLRSEIKKILEAGGINMTNNNRLYHILCYMGTLGIIVQGPIIDGDHAFVLADIWLKKNNEYSEDETLQQLCIRYFTSHGPATITDLQWRSGLGITVLKKGISFAGDILTHEDGHYYHRDALQAFNMRNTSLPIQQQKIHFLAGFDERLLGYKDRSATLDNHHQNLVDVSRNGIFRPTVMMDGKTIGTWSIKLGKKKNNLIISLFPEHKNTSIDILKAGIMNYEKYSRKNFEIEIT